MLVRRSAGARREEEGEGEGAHARTRESTRCMDGPRKGGLGTPHHTHARPDVAPTCSPCRGIRPRTRPLSWIHHRAPARRVPARGTAQMQILPAHRPQSVSSSRSRSRSRPWARVPRPVACLDGYSRLQGEGPVYSRVATQTEGLGVGGEWDWEWMGETRVGAGPDGGAGRAGRGVDFTVAAGRGRTALVIHGRLECRRTCAPPRSLVHRASANPAGGRRFLDEVSSTQPR
ncbi:hypothetical protein B0H11DRAFT_2404836 [Mycena galericulata]|nr:hypothetical protein B0H11DRAFT_2404836 [Mycena galericulata]